MITISRWAGSGGRYIAEHVSEALDYHFADYRLAERVLREYGLVQFPSVYGSVPDVWEFFSRRGQDRHEINTYLRLVTLAQAKHGNVVMLGRGCFVPLQGMGDVLNVQVTAPVPVRVDRIMNRHQMTHEEAAAFVRERDGLVAGFLRSAYGRDGHDARLFDLVIDTSKVKQEVAIRWITEAANSLETSSTSKITTATIEVDPLLAETVSKELGCHVSHTPEQ